MSDGCAVGEQQRSGVVQQRDPVVHKRVVPAGLPGDGRVLCQHRRARQRPGVLSGDRGPAHAVAGRPVNQPVLPAAPGPVPRNVRFHRYLVPGGLLQAHGRQDQHVPGGHHIRWQRDVRPVHLSGAHTVGPVVARRGLGHGRPQVGGSQGSGRVQRGRRTYTHAPRLQQRSDTQP